MKVRVFPYVEKFCRGNIIWAQRDRGSAYYRVSKYAEKNGAFPADHPCAPCGSGRSNDRAEIGTSDALKAFRDRGYWASCFPEGDGITWTPLNAQPFETTLLDIRECFGWETEAPRG